MMPPYRLANLNPDQMMQIEQLENELGFTLIAYEPEAEGISGQAAFHEVHDQILDTLNDDYRSEDMRPYPDIFGT